MIEICGSSIHCHVIYGQSRLAVLLAPLELAHSSEDGNRSKYMTNVMVKTPQTNALST